MKKLFVIIKILWINQWSLQRKMCSIITTKCLWYSKFYFEFWYYFSHFFCISWEIYIFWAQNIFYSPTTFKQRFRNGAFDVLQMCWLWSIENQCPLNSTAWWPIFSLWSTVYNLDCFLLVWWWAPAIMLTQKYLPCSS